jgi:murein DD-endopeptidase MepM/ murein hydrolase activator NlpD
MACIGTSTNSARILSRFGYRRGMQTGARTLHAGVDWAAPRGTPVLAPYPGIVELVSTDAATTLKGYGNAVVLRHPDLGLWSLYAHQDRVFVTTGQSVAQGVQLGVAGNTTNGRFSHRQGGGPETPHRREMVPHVHEEWRTAASGGASPFPGAYGTYNIDPLLVYRHLGRALNRAGVLVDVAECNVPALVADIRAGVGRRPTGLGQFTCREHLSGLPRMLTRMRPAGIVSPTDKRRAGGIVSPTDFRGLGDDDEYEPPEEVAEGRSGYGAAVGLAVLFLGATLGATMKRYPPTEILDTRTGRARLNPRRR